MRFVKEGLVASVVAGVIVGQLAGAQGPPETTPSTPVPPPSTGQANAQTAPANQLGSAAQATLKDIEATFGFVPQMFRVAADAQLPSMWDAIKNFQMADTALDRRTKELIGLAVGAQIPCGYCVYFHTEAARRNGATDAQIREAIGMASVTRMASTVLNGSQLDPLQFRKDVQRLMKSNNGKKQTTASASKEARP